MNDLTAQVTSSLLPFPGVTIDALGEDEITLDSVLHGNFTVGRSGLAWLACGPHLEVVHAVTGERLSAYCFNGGGENPPSVLAARDFSWLKRSGLLVGLEEAEGSVLCLYDVGLSRVVKAVVIPGRITAIEPLVSYGGASTSTQHLHQSLRWFFGIAALVTDLGHVLLLDLCLDDLSCSQSELEASDLQVVTKSPAEIPRLREVSSRQGRHLCLQLNAPSGVGATVLQYISRTNQLAVGFSDGNLQLWNMKTLKKEYHSQLEGGRVPVHAFTFQEPENDPRNCCYLWAVQSSQDLEGDMVSLRLLQLAFSERKCLASGKMLYEGLEYCEERYSQELSGTALPLRAQATNTRLLSCQTIEKFRHHPDRDDSMNEVASPDTSVSIFSWQVKAYGHLTPSTYIGVFDINRWYHAQMPDSLRMGESLQNCPYLAVWSLDPVVHMVVPNILLDVIVHDRSLSRGLPYTCPPPEQYFNPTTYNYDATCLFNSGIVHLTCSGYQKETLSFLKKAAPCSSDVISTSYSRCLMSGLLSSRPADTRASSLSQEEQLDAILSTAVETSCLGLITGCIKQWTAEEQPGSALNLRYILDWAWNKVVQTKEELDGICAPLFDSSSNFTDPQTMQLLQHSQRLLSNLSNIFHCLLSEAQELTQKGLVGLMNKNMVSGLISKYAQVVLWFCRTGLLPEGSDAGALQISRPFYTHSAISNYYTIRREELTRLAKGKWCADCLMIDGLVGHCGETLTNLWKRDDGGTGQYPPPSLHALLDIYLLDNIDEAAKHAIVIYLLLDVMYSFPNKEGASVESFPPAFAIPIGLVKLVQGLWLLDHRDHQSSFELLLHPAASQCQFAWQHERVLHALMCQGQHSVALRYFHVTKPPISSTTQAKLCLSVLLHNRCLIEAWSLLRQHSNHLNTGELLSFLYESCQELGLMKELLNLPLGLYEQECLEKFLQGTGGLQNRELLMVHYLQQTNYIRALQLNQSLKMNMVNERDPKLKERSNTRNSIMDQYGKVLPRVQRKLAMERSKPYQHPYAIHREVSRPQPLSTITKRSSNDKVMSRAAFFSNVFTKIEEVWLGKGATPQSSPAKSPRAADVQSPKASSTAFHDPFLGTPITKSAKRKSRLLDLVVHPSCQTPSLLSPARPPSSWVSPKSTSRAPELSLLQTPQVVKRARALAASGPVFSSFTPQSILRSSLRPTPVATPSASPGRSITPPLRSKGGRITFIGEEDEDEEDEVPQPEKGIRWTNGMAADSEISLLTRGAMPSKVKRMTWSSQPAEEEEDDEEEEEQPCVKFDDEEEEEQPCVKFDDEEEEPRVKFVNADEEEERPRVKFLPPEGGVPSPQLRSSNSPSSSICEVAAETRPSEATQAQVNVSFDTSHVSVRSTDTTLEFFDAPLSEEQEGDEVKDDMVVTINIKGLSEEEEPEEKPSPPTEQTVLRTSEDLEREDETFEDVMETAPAEEAEKEEEVQSEKEDEQDVEAQRKQQEEEGDAASLHQEEEMFSHDQVSSLVAEGMESGAELDSQDQPENAMDTGVQLEATESSEFTKQSSPVNEPMDSPEEELEQATDLTEFVQRHLFGGDMSPPLTRSGIHNTSHTQESFNSESPGEVEDEEKAAAEVRPAFTSQKSTASVTSSEPSGTDSHSVVSVNDSEDLSSALSIEEEEEEEEEEEDEEEEEESDQAEEEEEDSGSEVEIIEEVQGNGSLPPLQPTSVFVQQGHTHFLPSLSEHEAVEFSLIAPGAEIKMLGEDMEGEVVMVRLGADDGVMETVEEEDQGSSYMELKPSTTLLVPLDLMEDQDGLVDTSQLGLPELQQMVVPDEPTSEAPAVFSLMLDVDDDVDKEADTQPMENELESPEPPILSPVEEKSDELVADPEVILLGADDQDLPLSGETSGEDQRKETDSFDEANEVDGQTKSELVIVTDLQTENTGGNQEAEDAKEELEAEVVVQLAEDHEAAGVFVFESSPMGELPEVVDDMDSMAKKDAAEEEEKLRPTEEEMEEEEEEGKQEEMGEEQDKPITAEDQEVPDENGPVTMDTEILPSIEMGEEEEEEDIPTSVEEEVEKPTTAEEVMGDEDKETPSEDQEVTEENGPVTMDTEILPNIEMGEEEEEEDIPTSAEEEGEKTTTAEEVMGDEDKETPSEDKEVTEEKGPVTMDTEIISSVEMREEVEEDKPTSAEEVMDKLTTAEELMDKSTLAEDQEVPEEDGSRNTDVVPSIEMATVVVEGKENTVSEEENGEEIKAEKEPTKRTRGRPKKVKAVEEDKPMKQVLSSSIQLEEQPVPETPSSLRKKNAPSTPTRRTTRGRTVTFISPVTEEMDETEEEEPSTLVPAKPRGTPSKSTANNKEIKVLASTPRRSNRKAQPEPPNDEGEEVEARDDDNTPTATTSRSSPSRRRTISQKATPRKSSLRSGSEEVSTATEDEIKDDEEQGDEVTDAKVTRRATSKTPVRRQTAPGSTPRRSSRRTVGSTEVASKPLEILNEEKELDEVLALPVKRNSRKSKTDPTEMQPATQEEEAERNTGTQVSSPSRTTRQSNRNTLNVYPKVILVPVSLPQSARKTRGVKITENDKEMDILPEPVLNSSAAHPNSSLRASRSKLWNHPEEELSLLDSPLEVYSETPVADALIKRLQDEEEKQEGGVVVTKTVRTSKRSTKMAAEVLSLPEEDESSPGENSFIYSPSRRRTRAKRTDSPGPTEESAVPVTRSRRGAVKDTSVAPHYEIASEGNNVEVEKEAGAKTRKTGKRQAKAKGVSKSRPVIEVELLSPLPSPADPLPRAQQRIKEGEVPSPRINLRRKRIMDTVFPKPVTRRKKL